MIANKTSRHLGGGTNSRLGSILHGVGLLGVAICVGYVLDVIWVHQSGQSLLPISGRFVSRQDLMVTMAVGTVLGLLSWQIGVVARLYANRAAEKKHASANEEGITVPGRDWTSEPED